MRIGKKDARRQKSPIAALTGLFFMLALFLVTVGQTARADVFHPGTPVSLTVAPGGEDLTEKNVVLDIYQIASAVPFQKMDGYEIVPQDAYKAAFGEDFDGRPSFDKDQWRKIADRAARIALGTAPGTSAAKPLVKGASINTQIKNLPSAGLYLVIARGSDSGYIETLDDGTLVTTARTDRYLYRFRPELVALPGRNDGETNNTANTVPYQYDVEITLKPDREEGTASLEIIKILKNYETKDPATFVFQVEGRLGDRVYSDVVTIVFAGEDGPGRKSHVINNLPPGMNVTVTEVYSGANYQLTTDKEKKAVIGKDSSVSFTNDYDDTYQGGGSVTNQFDYDPTLDENGFPKGWTWKGKDDEGTGMPRK